MSIVLPEEEVLLDLKDVIMISKVDRLVQIDVTGCDIYTSGSKEVFALKVASDELGIIRENLQLPRAPHKLNHHISILERN